MSADFTLLLNVLFFYIYIFVIMRLNISLYKCETRHTKINEWNEIVCSSHICTHKLTSFRNIILCVHSCFGLPGNFYVSYMYNMYWTIIIINELKKLIKKYKNSNKNLCLTMCVLETETQSSKGMAIKVKNRFLFILIYFWFLFIFVYTHGYCAWNQYLLISIIA